MSLRSSILAWLTLAGAAMTVSYASASTDFYVSPGGNDASNGHAPALAPDGSSGPFATLEAARDAIRALKASPAGLPEGGITVHIMCGIHQRRATFLLTEQDSGSPEAPITYRADTGASPILSGGLRVTGFSRVTDPATRLRLDPQVRDHVLVANLRAQGVRDFGSLKRRGFGRGSMTAPLELIFDDSPMTLSRWPNDNEWAHIAGAPSGPDGGRFNYDGDRPSRWRDTSQLWVHGYWTWDWAESFERIEKIDTTSREFYTAAPHGVYGYKQGARYYCLNILEELDQPGEYFADSKTGLLYFWPPRPILEAEAWVTLLEDPMLIIDGASFVQFENLHFTHARGQGLIIRGGHDNLVAGCAFTHFANQAVSIEGGSRNGIQSCDLYHLGDGGIALSGGDRTTLQAAGLFAINNYIHHFSRTVRTYTPAISISGVGNHIANNLIHDAPHMAIGLHGNDHLIEYNEIHHVCMETHDAGAFYMGRDWTERGNVIRFNYLHEMGHGDVQAIYLDDWASGSIVLGNICQGARRGVLAGGGRDNIIENNIFIQCGCGIHIDQRGLGWAANYFDGTTNTLFDRMTDVNGSQPPYALRYPPLATLLNDEPVLAKGNQIRHNIAYQTPFLDLHNGLTPDTPYLLIQNNFEGDPGFLDPANGDYRIALDAPILNSGFKVIPIENIGLQNDAYRTVKEETTN